MKALLKSKKIYLRALEPADTGLLYHWENDTAVWGVSGTQLPFSRHILQQFIDEQAKDIYATRQARFVIETMADARPVGVIDLFDFDPANARAGVGVLIYGAENQRNGYAEEALRLLCRYASEVLHLHQLYANIGASNTASRALFEKCGFVECGLRREWINFTPGVVAGFSFAMRALTNEGDGVVINPPVYPPFAAQINANRRKVVNSPLIVKEGKYGFDFDDLDRKLAGAKALLFCSPHNPTGRVFSREELTCVGELCCKHNVYIISDEIHSDLAHKPHKHIHIASICKEFADRTITLIAPSKTFNVAGLSTSISITPNEEVHDMFRREMDQYHADQGNVFGTEAVIAGYNNGDEWLDQFNEYMAGNLQFIKEFVAKNLPEIKVCNGEASYIAWFDMRGLGMDDDALRRFMVDEAKVGLSEGFTFGEEGRGHMRMVTAVPRAVIAEVLDRIHKAYRNGKLKMEN